MSSSPLSVWKCVCVCTGSALTNHQTSHSLQRKSRALNDWSPVWLTVTKPVHTLYTESMRVDMLQTSWTELRLWYLCMMCVFVVYKCSSTLQRWHILACQSTGVNNIGKDGSVKYPREPCQWVSMHIIRASYLEQANLNQAQPLSMLK